MVWVLETAYDYPKKQIADVLEKILRTRQFHICQHEILWKALRDYKNGSADFADSVIGHSNIHNGSKTTLTFDKKAAKLSSFDLLKS